MSHLKHQTAIITGGGSGIGFAVAEALVQEGVKIVMTGRDGKKLDRARKRLIRKGGDVLAVPGDVSVKKDVDALVEEARKAFGRIHILVNNAGIGKLNSISETSEHLWDEVMDINLKGAFLCTKAVLPHLKRQRSGYVFNISSVAGKTGFGDAAAYCASKFGLVGLTESLLEEGIDSQIKATVICPGYVATPMVRKAPVPQNEMIPPEDIGMLIVWLLHLSPLTVIKEVVVERRGSIGS